MTYTELSEVLTDSLELARPPVAVCLRESPVDDVPEYTGKVPAGCRFWQEGTERVFATSAGQHDLCTIGAYTHNLAMTPEAEKELGVALNVFAQLGYVREQDVPAIPVLKSRPRQVVYGPLAEIAMTPDVVLLFVKANQALILSEASQQVEGGLPPAMGRPACAIVPQAFNTSAAALSLGCCGARAYVDALNDDVALYAIPGAKLEAYVERIRALAKANAVLSRFHKLRRDDVEAGGAPTIEQSLARLEE